jgi:hypothetical protein
LSLSLAGRRRLHAQAIVAHPKNQMTVSFAESYFNDTCPLLGESML